MENAVAPAYPPNPLAAGRLDFAQAASGVLLSCFVLAHAVFVGSVIISPALMDAVGLFFEITYLAQLGGPLIFLLMLLHFVLAARKMPLRTGELLAFQKHTVSMRHAETWLWLVQYATASAVLVLASIHMHEVLASLPVEAVKSADRERSRSAFYCSCFSTPDCTLPPVYTAWASNTATSTAKSANSGWNAQAGCSPRTAL